MLEVFLISMIILLVAPLLISLLSFPRKKKYSAEEYKLRLRQSIVTLCMILLSTVLNILRSQTSIKAFSYIAVAMTVATIGYLIASFRKGKKQE